jgi:hypothetical protein
MRIAQVAFYIFTDNPFAWRSDWAWGLPLIVLTVLIHVSGLGLISQKVVHGNAGRRIERRHPKIAFVVVLGATTLLATCVHGIEAGVWASAYRLLGALPDFRSCMLYSLNAITSYGHTNLSLEDHWHLMGAMEALNGWLLFGLTTAFLFAVIQNVWLLDNKREHR